MDDPERKSALADLTHVAADTDRLRAQAAAQLVDAVGHAADLGLTQQQIAAAIGRSQPEVSRLIAVYRADRFRPRTPLGRVVARHRTEILALATAHKARNVRVFGSVARGDDAPGSDIDLLVDLEPGADLMDLAALDIELEKLLGNPVDIVVARLIKPTTATTAFAEARPL